MGRAAAGARRRFIKAEWYGNEPIYEVREFSKDGEPLGPQRNDFRRSQKVKRDIK